MKSLFIVILFILSFNASADNISSSEYLVYNIDTEEILYEKNQHRKTPLASITKLMTAVVTLETNQDLNDTIVITKDDIDTLKNTTSRIKIGTILTKRQALKLALQSSENRSANALLRNYPGGYKKGIEAMNNKAKELKMNSTTFVDPTGLNSKNVTTASDLVKLIAYADRYMLIRMYSTSKSFTFKNMTFINSNPIVRANKMDVKLQKTGFINEAGFCVVMLTNIGGNKIAMIFMDAPSKYSRFNDASIVYKKLTYTVKHKPALANL